MYEVSFTVDPPTFSDALTEVNRFIEPSSGFLYVAAIDPHDSNSDLWTQQANAPDSEKGPRVVLGLEGEGGSYCFVDAPAESVSQPGEFIVGAASRLKSWSNVVKENTQITYTNDNSGQQIRLEYPNGYDTIPVRVWYTENNFAKNFQAEKRRFSAPQQDLADEDLHEMMQIATDVAPSSSDRPRSGDLIFSEGRGRPIQVEFLTIRDLANASVTAGTSQKATLGTGYPISDLEWEMQDRHLDLMKKLTGDPTAKGRVEWADEDEESDSVHIAYNDDGVYVERNVEIRRDRQPVDPIGWSDRTSLFGPSTASRLVSSVRSESLFRELSKTWSLSESKVVRATTGQVEGQEVLQVQTENDSNQKRVQSENGSSQIEGYYMVPESQGLMESIVGGADMLQIRSFPVDGKENETSYIIVPVPESRGPTDRFEPARFLTVTVEASV